MRLTLIVVARNVENVPMERNAKLILTASVTLAKIKNVLVSIE